MGNDIKPRAARPAPVTAAPVPVAKSKAAKPAAIGAVGLMPVTAAPAAPPAPVAAPAQPAPAVTTPMITLPETLSPVIEPTPTPEPVKEVPMNETITSAQNGAAEAIKSGATAAYTNGKAALEQVTSKSKETIEAGMKHMDELSAMTKGNVEALLASAKAATAGLESIGHQVADFSRKSFEETTAVARAMTTVKTPNEFMQLQNDFAKKQFDAAVAEMSKMSETLVKLAGEVFEPVQNRVAVATDKMKSAIGSSFNR